MRPVSSPTSMNDIAQSVQLVEAGKYAGRDRASEMWQWRLLPDTSNERGRRARTPQTISRRRGVRGKAE